MFGLFLIGSIEDYYEVDHLVAVSEDSNKLEVYIAKQHTDYELYKILKAKYWEIRNALPKFDEVAPVKLKLGFNPKTRAEHDIAALHAREHNEACKFYYERSFAFEHERNEEAYIKLCRQEELWQTDFDKNRVMGHSYYDKPPEYKIEEVEVW